MTRSAHCYPAQLHPDSPKGHAPQCNLAQLHPDSPRGYAPPCYPTQLHPNSPRGYALPCYPAQLHPDSPRGHAPPCYPDQLHLDSLRRTCAAMLSRLPQGEAQDTREHHTSDDSISYPDRLSGWKTLTKVSKPCYIIPSPSDCVSGRPVQTSLPWIPKNSPQSQITLVIKKLSKHQNLTQFD